jgi:hypothetical protein
VAGELRSVHDRLATLSETTRPDLRDLEIASTLRGHGRGGACTMIEVACHVLLPPWVAPEEA